MFLEEAYERHISKLQQMITDREQLEEENFNSKDEIARLMEETSWLNSQNKECEERWQSELMEKELSIKNLESKIVEQQKIFNLII